MNFVLKFYGDHPRGTPPSGVLNTRGVAEYSDFGPIERYIWEMAVRPITPKTAKDN